MTRNDSELVCGSHGEVSRIQVDVTVDLAAANTMLTLLRRNMIYEKHGIGYRPGWPEPLRLRLHHFTSPTRPATSIPEFLGSVPTVQKIKQNKVVVANQALS